MQAQLLIEQHPGAGAAFAVDQHQILLLQVRPGADILRVALLHIESCTAGQQVDDDIGGANEQLADIGQIIFAGISVQQMGADDIGLAVIHGDQAVQASRIGTERTGGRQAALQMAGQNVQ
ncbi:hypothetical protein D3C75_1115590 [compost metagenome]